MRGHGGVRHLADVSPNQMVRVNSGVGPIQDIVASDAETRIALPMV